MTNALELRRTHKYVGTYRHEDKWDHIGSFDTVASGSVRTDDEDPCEPTKTTHLLRVKSDASKEDIEQALKDSHTFAGCHHEYDCCGCWSTYVDEVTQLKDDLWMVVCNSSRNY